MERIGILKERADRRVVVLSPAGVARLAGKAELFVQRDAGRAAGFANEAYEQAGARVLDHEEDVMSKANILLSYDHHFTGEPLGSNKIFIGSFDPLSAPKRLQAYLNNGVTAYSLDLMPRTSVAQAMDVLSSVASISGYQAVLLAAERSLATVPMITSAGGTLRPAHFLMLGAGVAGLQAIATARRLGAVVKAYDVRTASKEEVESLGAEFIEVEGALNDRSAGGYAVEQPEAFLARVRERIHREAKVADVIITTARIPGKKAPQLITEEMVMDMRPGAVIVDLAASSGGNCAVTLPDRTIMRNEVTVIGPTSIECSCAHSTSFLLSNNYATFIEHYLLHHQDPQNDPILRSTLVVDEGQLVNERIRSVQTMLNAPI